eukprot:TRINITY_DN7014_c0_g1_i1.p1 TRINITY_DN7014_c0_g1~~TRINITY_DN7014_c0_g1_i1.p1  ORF type:complete len:103 (+),score=13.63 TRINITY_DN7014_c0_g1_i1:389-697(+)
MQRLSHEMIKLANTVVKTLHKHIAKHGLDKQTGGLLGAIGLGHKSRHSLEFRIASAGIATFLTCQSDGKANFFWHRATLHVRSRPRCNISQEVLKISEKIGR